MTPKPRKTVLIRLGRGRLWRWHLELVRRLAQRRDMTVILDLVDSAPPLRACLLLMTLEKLTFRITGDHACDRVDESAFAGVATTSDHPADTILDLSGMAPPSEQSRVIQILYDGALSDDAAISAALDGRGAELTAVDIASGRQLGAAQPAIEDRVVLIRALDTVFSALLQLCVKVVTASPDVSRYSHAPSVLSKSIQTTAVIAFGFRALALKVNNRLGRLCREGPKWAVGWRRREGEELPSSSLNDYRRLADDSGRYYADPFLLEAGGATFLFVEEYVRALGKGIISAATLGADGDFTRPRPVLETGAHLSYPLVFAHAGHVWMIPESLQTRSVELYRAVNLPGEWTHEATLLSDIEASDATVIQRDGLWWMFVSTRDWLGSNWDTLSVFWAEQLRGPWRPHDANPIAIDSRSARPAGHFFEVGGMLWRPSQDCSEGYGTGLSLCRIDRLDQAAVEESVEHRIRLRNDRVSRGPHTFNRIQSLEVIDLFEPRSSNQSAEF